MNETPQNGIIIYTTDDGKSSIALFARDDPPPSPRFQARRTPRRLIFAFYGVMLPKIIEIPERKTEKYGGRKSRKRFFAIGRRNKTTKYT